MSVPLGPAQAPTIAQTLETLGLDRVVAAALRGIGGASMPQDIGDGRTA